VTNKNKNPMNEQVPMRVGGARLQVEVRDDEEDRALGLSYRDSLGENEGMVFVFDSAQPQRFWMRGMQFPLDMIWIRDGRVVEVTENVPAPASESETPVTVSSKEEADIVLEVNGGWVARHGVRVGDAVILDNGAN
jgi:uncharacterized membrane protein (UPF0127 family)